MTGQCEIAALEQLIISKSYGQLKDTEMDNLISHCKVTYISLNFVMSRTMAIPRQLFRLGKGPWRHRSGVRADVQRKSVTWTNASHSGRS